MGRIKEKLLKECIKPSTSNTLGPTSEKVKRFYEVPTGPATHRILSVLGSGKDNLNTSLAKRAKKINHDHQIEILQDGEKRLVTITSNNSTVTLELADIEKLTGSNKTAKKLFIFNLIKMNQQAYSMGVLRRNYIQFSLQELQNIGFYKTPQSARTGFKNGMDILTSLKVKGSMKKGKQEIATALEVLFTGTSIENGVCTVYINERINWAFIASFYTILPHYSFKLSNRAFDLILYIFYLARQNLEDIKIKGSFNIGLIAIQNQLQLPNESGCVNPSRDIKKPIETAIAEILRYSNNTEFTIEPVVDNNAPISYYLNNGYIKISLKGDYAKNFITLHERKEKQIETANKKRENIIEKAKIMNTVKKLEKNE